MSFQTSATYFLWKLAHAASFKEVNQIVEAILEAPGTLLTFEGSLAPAVQAAHKRLLAFDTTVVQRARQVLDCGPARATNLACENSRRE